MAWYNSNWQYRKKITIDSAKVDGDLTDFPVLVNLDSDGDLSANAQPSGDDILFTDSDGTTKLDHEIENYDGSTGTLWAHVKDPSISSSSDTELYIYYGNSGAANQENVTGVWTNGYEGVWHLDEEASGTGNADVYKDSTGNDNHGDDQVSATGQDGQVFDGQNFDGADDYIDVNSTSILQNAESEMTISLWINTSSQGSYETWFSYDGFASGGMLLQKTNDDNIRLAYNGTEVYDGAKISDFSSYKHIVATVLGSLPNNSFINGSKTAFSGSSSDDLTTLTHPSDTELGRRTDSTSQYLDGAADEIRVASVERSDAWISTTYNNQNSPSTFYTVGGEEVALQSERRVSRTGKNSGTVLNPSNNVSLQSRPNNEVEQQ